MICPNCKINLIYKFILNNYFRTMFFLESVGFDTYSCDKCGYFFKKSVIDVVL